MVLSVKNYSNFNLYKALRVCLFVLYVTLQELIGVFFWFTKWSPKKSVLTTI